MKFFYKLSFLIVLITIVFTFLGTSVNHRARVKQDEFDCYSLTQEKVIYEIATAIIEAHDNEQIWNISEIDTTDFFTMEGCFVNRYTHNRLVLVGGNAGMSSGSVDNLLILFSCLDTYEVIWAGQVGEFDQDGIRDLNNDGVLEIVCNGSMMWMGECRENYEIFNFKNGQQHILYKASSSSVIDCGAESLGYLKRGDTLEHTLACSLLKSDDRRYAVQQISIVKIHNGGKSDKEILQQMKVNVDTAIVKLK